MTKVYIEDYIVPSATIGEENPLPTYRRSNPNSYYDPDYNRVPEGYDRQGFGWATGSRVLPYRMQDNYSRERQDKAWFSVVLENEYLKARVVPGMGGKLVSLFDKKGNRDLFVTNPVFQPGNLALRNAWTSGGAEYNFGQIGHHFQTCEPLHCALVDTELGKAVRIFTWDRLKKVSYHYDFCLPEDSPYLMAYVRLVNPNEMEIPVYWWTNIAVPVYDKGRVIAPADSGYLDVVVYDIADKWKGDDLTYPDTVEHSYDIFFRIPKEGQRRWEVNADGEGNGFLYASTERLIGRKMFTWGEGTGGRHWNEFLSTEDTPTYLEVQGGLAYSQMHSVPMPAETEWDWLEMYGAYEGPKEAVVAPWKEARTMTGEVVDRVLPQSVVDNYFEIMKKTKNKQGETVFTGQGWGALENYRAKITGKKSAIPSDFAFMESDMTEKQAMWKEFLETGILKAPASTTEAPGEYMIQEEWLPLVQKAAEKDNNWFVNFHLGVFYMERLNYSCAEGYFQISNSLCENPWATYSLAVIAKNRDNKDKYFELLEKAYKLNPLCPQLLHELCHDLYEDERFDKLNELIVNMDPSLLEFERIKLDAIKNALKQNDFDTIDKYINYDFATNREGEILLSEIWFEMMARKRAIKAGAEFKPEMVEEFIALHDEDKCEEWEKLPYRFNFRMAKAGDFYTPPTER
ncbi:MAG: DUF5107 domain-containing protein [Armatimonadetes bacterium]|nr:DUF5107 domain-containing protein [Candidatus Hippobium faecium]